MRKILSLFALAAVLLSGVVSAQAQNSTPSDLNAVGAKGYVNAYEGSLGSSTSNYGCTVTVTKMPSSGAPGTLKITDISSAYSYWLKDACIAGYVSDKNGRKFVVTRIDDNAFTSNWAQKNVTNITIHYDKADVFANYVQGKFEIGASAFEGCEVLTEVRYAPLIAGSTYISCDRIGAKAFKNCPKYNSTRIRVVEGGTIGSEAFANCTSLSAIHVSGTIDKTAFEGCTGVKDIYWYGNGYGHSKKYSSSTESPFYPLRGTVTKIHLYSGVQGNMFTGFSALTEVVTPADIWDKLKNVNIYEMGIGYGAFGSCYNLKTISVAGKIDPSAFYSCSQLSSITYRGAYLSQSSKPADNGESYFANYAKTVTSFAIESTSTENIPNTFIPAYLCYDLYNLTSLSIPNYVTTIEEGAFRACSSLTSVTLPASIKYIGESAFENCSKLATCPLGSSHTALKTIGKRAFARTAINSFYVPESVTSMGGQLVDGCKSLKGIRFYTRSLTKYAVGGSYANLFFKLDGAERQNVESFYVNPELTVIPDSLFYDFEGMQQVLTTDNSTYLSKVKSVGKAAFYNCKAMWGAGSQTKMENVTEVGESAFEGSNYNGACKFEQLSTIGKRAFANTQLMYMHDMGTMANLKSIGEEAFADNAKLASAEFNGVQTIGVRAFANNAKLETITISKAVPAIQSNTFEGCNVKSIKASCSIIDAIKADANWTAVCANIQATDTKYTQSYLDNLLGNNYGDSWWSYNGKIEVVSDLDCEGNVTLKCNPDEGYTFAYWRGDGSTENPRDFDLSNYDLWYLGAQCYNEANLYQTNFQVKPAGAGAIKITNQYGHNRNDQKFIIMGNVDREEAYLTPMSNGWYDFKEWEYDEGAYSMRPEERYETPGTYSLMLDVMENMGAGEFDPETGMWIDGGTTYDPQFDPNLTAVFELKAVPVTVERCTDGNGTVELSEVYSSVGSTVTLTATPKEGFEFDQWEDGNKDATREVTILPEMLTELQPMGMDPELGEETYNEYPVDMGDGMLEAYHPESSYKLSLCAQFKKKDATAVETITNDELRITKVLRDGVLYILRDGKIYSVQGQRVK